MSTLADTRQVPQGPPVSGGRAMALLDRRPEPEAFGRRCPECERLDYSDSQLSGVCEYCAGLVPLQPV